MYTYIFAAATATIILVSPLFITSWGYWRIQVKQVK
jgi:hypothetical protein